MVYSKIYGFLPPSKVIDVDDGVAAVGYKSLSTPPLLILNRRTPLVITIISLFMRNFSFTLQTTIFSYSGLYSHVLTQFSGILFLLDNFFSSCSPLPQLVTYLISITLPSLYASWFIHVDCLIILIINISLFPWISFRREKLNVYRKPGDQLTWKLVEEPVPSSSSSPEYPSDCSQHIHNTTNSGGSHHHKHHHTHSSLHSNNSSNTNHNNHHHHHHINGHHHSNQQPINSRMSDTSSQPDSRTEFHGTEAKIYIDTAGQSGLGCW